MFTRPFLSSGRVTSYPGLLARSRPALAKAALRNHNLDFGGTQKMLLRFWRSKFDRSLPLCLGKESHQRALCCRSALRPVLGFWRAENLVEFML